MIHQVTQSIVALIVGGNPDLRIIATAILATSAAMHFVCVNQFGANRRAVVRLS